MDFPLEPVSSMPIYKAGPADATILPTHGVDSGASAVGSSLPEESVMVGSCAGLTTGNIFLEDNGPAESAQSTGHADPHAPEWIGSEEEDEGLVCAESAIEEEGERWWTYDVCPYCRSRSYRHGPTLAQQSCTGS